MSTVPNAAAEVTLWDMLGDRLPRGLLGLSDPDVHVIDGQCVMFIGGFSTTFRNRLYSAAMPVGTGPGEGCWVFDRRPLVPDPRRGEWDAGGMHAPSYVPAHEGRMPRIYYAGRATARRYGEGSAYAIGFIALDGSGAWKRREAPVLTGSRERTSVLEPLVIPIAGGYRMWFLSAPHEVGPGEQPDFELRVADSSDGVEWRESRRFSTSSEGFFDNAVYRAGQGWEMALARGTNLHGTTPYPDQGLWLLRAGSPSADRSDWSDPVRVLDTDEPGTPSWMGRGVCGPAVIPLPNGRRRVYLTGTHSVRSWRQAVRVRLRSARRLPAPAPYFLATGSVDITV